MHNHSTRTFTLLESHRKLAVESLKRCPVCETVNAKLNMECFVCRWHGEFNSDPVSVEEGLYEVLEHCPELIDCILNLPKPRASWLERARAWLYRTTHKSLDLEA